MKTSSSKEYTCPMHPEVVRQSPGLCPKCGMALESDHRHLDMVEDFKNRFWTSLILTIPVLFLSPMITGWKFAGNLYALFGLSSCIFFYGGWPFLKGLVQELRARMPGMMTLIGIAITAAYVYSSFVVFGLKGTIFFWELATLIDIMLLGHWIEMRSVMGAGKALEELVKLMPSQAHKIMSDGSIRDVPMEELAVSDRVLIRPGEKIPADGAVVEGESSVNESMLTGESVPVRKEKGSGVIGGSINAEGSLTVEIRKMGKDSFLAQVIDMVQSAQESKSRAQDLANRAAMWLTIIALVFGLLTFLIWTLLTDQTFGFALERSVTVMVIACPHALGLAVPLVIAVSTAIAARRGLLIRNRTAFEAARNIQAIVFDKTGTLTEGKFGVTDVQGNLDPEELLNYAGALEIRSEHPIARAIVERCKEKWPVEQFKAIPGVGVEGRVKGRHVQVVQDKNARAKTTVSVLIDGKVEGTIALADLVRKESKEAVEKLGKMGIRCLMLTGDNKSVAKSVAGEIGLDEYFAEVLPNQKAEKIKEVQSRGLIVAMVGDGVNDAPALAQADVGIAIGAGTNIAIETADIILVKSNPLDAVAAISLARKTYRKMVQNLLWATGYNTVAIPLAAGLLYSKGIVISPAIGAAVMSISTVIVAINARLLHFKG